ncbi:hypothetical protein MUU72_02200 [Streptomyces sp. RS10V-4]|uniref:hypothetical protein n=1 Tax=Streptomyces rhizoryzae TaxID=2932493 RepID=UPI002006B78A|nr:hypothetical protein [Streptomyces rhizoryzae]MCK7621947.1 hypothetical protein [Streptomyces rhizoryzae]
MTTTPRTGRAPLSAAVLRAVTLAACLPYLALKAVWLGGGHLGIPARSPLRGDGGTLMAFNALTVVMDAAVIVLAFLLTRAWGRRVPGWLLAVPVWAATGLLAPIAVVFPVQELAGAFTGGSGAARGGGDAALVAPWVWTVVYTGFLVQALALGALFVRYARERWGRLWRGPLAALPEGPARSAGRLVAGAVAVPAVLPAVMHLLWAAGGTAGLPAVRAAARTLDDRLTAAGFALFALVTVVAVALLGYGGGARRRGGRLPLLVPLAGAWVGSGALAGWGGWLLLTALAAPAGDPSLPTPLMNLTYAVQMITGMLVAAAGAYFFTARAADTAGQEGGAVRGGAADGTSGAPGAVRCG